jgi:hypothetical protein
MTFCKIRKQNGVSKLDGCIHQIEFQGLKQSVPNYENIKGVKTVTEFSSIGTIQFLKAFDPELAKK